MQAETRLQEGRERTTHFVVANPDVLSTVAANVVTAAPLRPSPLSHAPPSGAHAGENVGHVGEVEATLERLCERSGIGELVAQLRQPFVGDFVVTHASSHRYRQKGDM